MSWNIPEFVGNKKVEVQVILAKISSTEKKGIFLKAKGVGWYTIL